MLTVVPRDVDRCSARCIPLFREMYTVVSRYVSAVYLRSEDRCSARCSLFRAGRYNNRSAAYPLPLTGISLFPN